MTFPEFITMLGKIESEKPDTMREGQWAFIVLHTLDKNLADELRDRPDADPFYNDNRLPEFYAAVFRRLSIGGKNDPWQN